MATNAQIKANMGLVRRIAFQLISRMPPSVDADDMLQVGLIGLADAIDRFEDGHGATFETFATQRIRGAMLDELRANDWMSRQFRRERKAVEEAQVKVEQRVGRPPADSEVAAHLGIGIREYQQELTASQTQLVYLEDLAMEEGDGFLDRYCVDSADPVEQLIELETNRVLAKAISSLTERERYAFTRRARSAAVKDIAASLEVTPARVSQLLDQAIHKVRRKLAA